MEDTDQQKLNTSRKIVKSSVSPKSLSSITIDDIQFIGKPSRMKGQVTLHNSGNDTIWVQDLDFVKTRKLAPLGFPETLRVNARLAPGETKTQTVRVSLPNTIRKGTYDTKLKVATRTVDVTFEVQDEFNLLIFPREFITQGVLPDHDYDFKMVITNNGNMDYTIPKLNHSMVLDTQYDCKAQSWSTMNDAKDGEQAFQDGYYKRVNAKYAFWVKITLQETGQVIKAGKSMPVNLKLRLPKEVDRNACYSGEIAIVGKQIIKYQLLA